MFSGASSFYDGIRGIPEGHNKWRAEAVHSMAYVEIIFFNFGIGILHFLIPLIIKIIYKGLMIHAEQMQMLHSISLKMIVRCISLDVGV